MGPKPKAQAKSKGRPPRYIRPIPENFQRTKKGTKLIKQELQKILDLQTKLFPRKSMFDVNKENVRFTKAGSNQSIKISDLLTKAPIFFSKFFGTIKRKLDFGQRVHRWFSDVAWLDFYFSSFFQPLAQFVCLFCLLGLWGQIPRWRLISRMNHPLQS